MANFLNLTGLDKVIYNLKRWVDSLFNSVLIITDDNWKDYVNSNYYTRVYAYDEEFDYSDRDTVGSPELISFSEVDSKVKDGKNVTIKNCYIDIPRYVRSIQIAMEHINLENVTLYPADYNNTNDIELNGYRLTIFQLPSYQMDDSYRNYSNTRIFCMNSDYYNELPGKGGLYNKNLILKTGGSETFSGELPVDSVSVRIRVDWGSSISAFENVSIINYNRSIDGHSDIFRLKPGRVAELMWFNGYWYTLGSR